MSYARPFWWIVLFASQVMELWWGVKSFPMKHSTFKGFVPTTSTYHGPPTIHGNRKRSFPKLNLIGLRAANFVPEKDVKKGIDQVVNALRSDKTANSELGRLNQVTIVLGYGLQEGGKVLALRFNASFRKSGKGTSAVPLPFGLGQSNVSEGRGTMVGQVKATVDPTTGKVTSCSVFRDLGYGRSFNLKV